MKRDIKFPKEAQEFFNRKAEELLELLRPEQESQHQKRNITTSEDHASRGTLDITISDTLQYSTINMIGEETSRFFHAKSGYIGLSEDCYSKFDVLAYNIANKSSLKDAVSKSFIKDSLFDWLEKRYKGELSNNVDFVNFLITKTKETIKTRKIALPISNLAIEKPFEVGNVLFDFFAKELFDQLERTIEANSRDERESKQRFINRIRKKYQGVVYASISIEAEIKKSIEIAKQETEEALVVLRFFSPSSIFPRIPSYYGMMGKATIPTSCVFIFESDLPAIIEGVDERREFRRVISDNEFQGLRKMGLEHASDLIKKEKRNKFEDLIISCLFLFSRAVESSLFQDKLVLTLVSIETLLLKDASEPIQYSIGLRLAFLAASTVETRKEVIDIVKKAYKLRGDYLHHGKPKTDLQLLRDLQRIVWKALKSVLVESNKYCLKKEFLDSIQEKILSD